MALYTDYTTIETSVTDVEAINNSIYNILLTRKGSLPGKPRFGSDIYDIIFSPITHITESIIRNIVYEALGEFEPRIITRDVTVDKIPEFNKLIVNVTYTYRDKGIEKNNTTAVSINI